MKKLAYLILPLLWCVSCAMPKSVKYSSEFHIVNNLGYAIEVFKGDSYFATLHDQEDMILYEEYSDCGFYDICEFVYGFYYGFDYDGMMPPDIALYSQGIYSHDLLKIWKFDEREEPGKQLYRLTDSKREVTTEDVDQSFFTNGKFHTWGCFYVRYCFTFIINPEDI